MIQSVIETARNKAPNNKLDPENLSNLQKFCQFRRRFRVYLCIKRVIPLSLVAPFTQSELSKMALAQAIACDSIKLTLPGLIGYSLPAFFFFHMTYYYAPTKLKPICQVCKYTLGAPFWIISTMVDELTAPLEEHFVDQPVPIDVTTTGGTIPPDITNLQKLPGLLGDAYDSAGNIIKWMDK